MLFRSKLPPVLPVVLYNGKAKWSYPCEIGKLIETFSRDLDRYAPKMEFLLLDESRFCAEDLRSLEIKQGKNLVSALFRLENATDNHGIIEVVEELLSWIELPRQQNLSRAIAAWFNRVFRESKNQVESIPVFEDLSEVKSMLRETVQQWRKEAVSEGLKEGMEKGMEKGRTEGALEEARRALTTVLEARFGKAEADKQAYYIGEMNSVAGLNRLIKKAVKAKSIEDLGVGR